SAAIRASGPSRVPRSETSAPLARSASATASAGTTCPAVPPAAITTLGTARCLPSFGGARAASSSAAVDDPQSRSAATGPGRGRGRAALGDVQQQARGGEHHEEARVAVRDERQRDAGERREPHDGEEVDDRL